MGYKLDRSKPLPIFQSKSLHISPNRFAPPMLLPCTSHPRGQEWALLRVWDAMEFESEENETASMGLHAKGDLDPGQTKKLMSPDSTKNFFLS